MTIKLFAQKMIQVGCDIQNEVCVHGKLLLRVVRLSERHLRFDGEQTELASWLLLERGVSVAALVWDPQSDQVVLIEQFRPGVRSNILEIPAGTVEPDENPDDCICREVEEETGLKVVRLTNLGEYYLSPGGTTEKIILYMACVNGLGENGTTAGLVSENENIKKHILSRYELYSMIDKNEIKDAKTLMVAQWWRFQDYRNR